MSEPSLALAKSDFDVAISDYFGYGLDLARWSTKQKARIKAMNDEGHRIFYFPQPLPNESTAYDWSFLHPTDSVTLENGEQTVEMPADFGGFEGSVTIADSTAFVTQMRLLHEGTIRKAYADYPDETGSPRMLALRPIRGTTSNAGQRSELYVFPEADADYTLEFQYYILPNCLTGNHPWSYGGAAHASTIRAACLKACEVFEGIVNGPQGQNFMVRLAASIGMDRKNKPQSGGRNRDRSDEIGYGRPRPRDGFTVTVGGIVPE